MLMRRRVTSSSKLFAKLQRNCKLFRIVLCLLKLYMVILAQDIGPVPSIGADDCYGIQAPDNVLINCTDRSLITVPKLPKNSIIITLDRNNITSITNLPFLGMENLQSVNLSCNPLRYIIPELFKGLSNLQRIYFLQCQLYHQKDLDYHYLLSDIIHLEVFAQTFKYFFCTPNIKHLSEIKQASDLTIDAFVMLSILDSDINATQAKTKRLILRNDGDCIIHIFRKRMFSTFVCLESVHIYSKQMRVFVEQDTFSQMDNLIVLMISNAVSKSYDKTPHRLDWSIYDWSMDLFMYNISASVSKLKHFRELGMEGVNYPWPQRNLNCSLALSKLSNSKSLKVLSLNRNSLSLRQCLNIGKPGYQFPALETLELRENCLGAFDVFFLLMYFERLKYIDARYQNWCYNLKMEKDTFQNPARKMISRKTWLYGKSDLQELYFSYSQDQSRLWFKYRTHHMFNKLRKLEFTWLKDKLGYSLAVPREFMTRRPNLQYLDLSGSGISKIDINTFNISTLKTLYLSDNHVGEMGSNLSYVLKDLTTLVELHLANNGITDLAENVFCSMNLLITLDLSKNELFTLTPSLKYLTSLKLLNISKNRLTTLSQMNRNDLDKINQYRQLVIDLNVNRFLCTCDTLAFLKWVVSTHVTLYRKDQLSCTASNNQRVFMNKLNYEIGTLESACTSDTVLAIVCSLGAALCIACLVSVLVYKFRWRLRYLYYMAKLRFSNTPDAYERVFDYDAFISYASDDFNVARSGCIEHLENAKDFRLFIHERDFVPGQAIAYNISVGIHSSKMTIFFLSDAFLSSEWCLYEFNIARMESLYSRRTVILIVLLQKSIVDKLPVDILDVIRSVTYLEYPEHGDEDDTMVFWNKLADCIQRN